ncbi:MAG: phosphoribosylglycinamide formyltransferase [Pseudomonadota bacterium]
MSRTKVAVLISGRGSNMQSLIDAAADADYPAEISLVISNRPKASGIERARAAGVATGVIDHTAFGSKDMKYEDGRAEFDAALDAALSEAGVDYVCLAGFMRLLTPDFARRWRGRMLNIHPSLLPAFKGLAVHERMITAGVKIAGCTVHFVTGEMDGGPIIGQAAVPVLPDDDADSLATRILAEEHKLYPACLKLLASGRARLTNAGVVVLDEDVCASAGMHNPDA